MPRPAGLKALIAQRNLLIALTRFLMQDRTGGVLGAAIEMLAQVLKASGALAYLVDDDELVLVAHSGLPRRTKAWLSHLPLGDEPWFVAQRVAHERKREVDTELAASRAGMGIRPALQEAGWRALAAVPLMVGREVLGVIVIASTSEGAFDRETMNMLEAVGGIIALSLERNKSLAEEREDKASKAETAQLATMGLVASNVARDLAAPVGGLTLQLDEQQQDLRELRRSLEREGGDPVVVKALELLEDRALSIFDTVQRMQGLTSRLLSFSRETRPEPVDLARIVERVAETVQSNLEAKNVLLHLEGLDHELTVDGREESLQMLVLQLVLYAAQECEGTTEAPEIVVRIFPEADHNVVAVAATGRSGQQSGARIYGSMVKGNRKAVVGLELAKQTALMHGGRIETGISDLGGVRLQVSLPASSARAAHPASTPVPEDHDVEDMVQQALEAAPRSGGIDLDLDLPVDPGVAPADERDRFDDVDPGSLPALELDEPDDLETGSSPSPASAGNDESPAAEEAGPASARPLVLWIDDEVESAEAIGKHLLDHDLRILATMAEARQAIEALEAAPAMVLCSVTLPDGSGTELHGEADFTLASRFVFIVGGLVSGDQAAYVQRSGCPTLIKPLTPDEVTGILASPSAAFVVGASTSPDADTADVDLEW